MDRLAVFKDNMRVGALWLDRKRCFVFCYDQEYLEMPGANPLSLSLPLQESPFENDSARPFFTNLLPEGDIREMIARLLNISKKNDIMLLEKIGGECAGAVSILPEGQTPNTAGEYIPISFDELDSVIGASPKKPLLVSRDGIRLSLAGAQDKLPVYIRDGQFFLSSGNMPSSHILKPENRYFEGTVQNEAFCMTLAKNSGLSVPDVFIRNDMKNIAYVIERYDRITHSDGHVSRIHQEDICQAMGLLPDQKYESEGGPGLPDCFTLIEKFSTQPLADRIKLTEWVIFNYLIGNADAHAKNLSILFFGQEILLAPFYDLMSTLVYQELVSKMSMKIGKENRFKWVQKRHWERFAQETGVKPKFLFSRARELAEKVQNESEKLSGWFVSKYGGDRIVGKICEIIRKHGALFSDVP